MKESIQKNSNFSRNLTWALGGAALLGVGSTALILRSRRLRRFARKLLESDLNEEYTPRYRPEDWDARDQMLYESFPASDAMSH